MSPHTRPHLAPRARRRLVLLARVVFLVAVGVATWVAFRGHGDDVLRALAATPVQAVVGAGGLVVLGLVVTSVAWLRVLSAFGHPLAPTSGRAVFFVGQLGKYVPGGVWSIGAHAHLAGEHDVPARVTAGTSLVFLGLNVATASLVVGAATATGAWDGPLTDGLAPLLVVGGLVALAPAVVTRLAGVIAGRAGRLRLDVAETARLVALLLLTWTCYAGAVVLLVPDPAWTLLPLAAGGFALSYAVGVAVVVAPAGVGAREVTLVALLAPAVGLGPATAVAVLTRLLHTGGDLTLALVAWLLARHEATTDVPGPFRRRRSRVQPGLPGDA